MSILVGKIILGISLIGIVVILFRKIPALNELQPEEKRPLAEVVAGPEKEQGVANPGAAAPLFNNFLQKSLLRSRILTLKLENKLSVWLEKLRQKNKGGEPTDTSSDNYWEQLKK